jgi:hypothetical protein
MFRRAVCLVFAVMLFATAAQAIERRRSQFATEFGYLVAPIPFILPGVGTGLGLLGAFNNFYDTTDLYLVYITGDVEGTVSGITEIQLVPENVLLDFTYVGFNKGSQVSYGNRGMDSDPDDFYVSEIRDTSLVGGRLTFTFFERRVEFFALQYEINLTPSALIYQGKEENRQELKGAEQVKFSTLQYGSQLDFTDDRLDPRVGLRGTISRSDSPTFDEDESETFTVDTNITGYIPLLESSTFAINYFRSDAFVTKEGLSDYDTILAELQADYDCANITCDEETLAKDANNTALARQNGTASSLGGSSRLRSYGGGRFSGAHTEFWGYEFRWNLTDENTPFDLYFIRDFRTGFQIAFFYEIGTVAETKDELWEDSKSSQGVGARLVTASGFVYRFDVATGDEGSEVTLFIDYPWGTIAQ